jgi:hypothetical protein
VSGQITSERTLRVLRRVWVFGHGGSPCRAALNDMKTRFPRLACCGPNSNKMLGSANNSKICKDRGVRPLPMSGDNQEQNPFGSMPRF